MNFLKLLRVVFMIMLLTFDAPLASDECDETSSSSEEINPFRTTPVPQDDSMDFLTQQMGGVSLETPDYLVYQAAVTAHIRKVNELKYILIHMQKLAEDVCSTYYGDIELGVKLGSFLTHHQLLYTVLNRRDDAFIPGNLARYQLPTGIVRDIPSLNPVLYSLFMPKNLPNISPQFKAIEVRGSIQIIMPKLDSFLKYLMNEQAALNLYHG